MPGTTDHGTHVTFLSSLRHALPAFVPGSTRAAATPPVAPPASPDTPSDTSPATPPRHSRAIRIGALTTALIVVAGGAFAVANAHKTVTLDVDGEISQVSTFAGSIAGLLDEQGVETVERDVVAPDSDADLRGGDDVVVRHAHPVTVLVDGEGTTVWTTALNADEALSAFASRGDEVSLVASRSGGSRADLSFRLAAGPVDVVVDGRTEHADGRVGLERVLADLGITLGEYDRVHVVRLDGRLTVVVQRVEVREEATTSAVPFETATQAAADLYRGQQRTVVAGVPGVRTTTSRVVLVDGVQESRLVIGDAVTTPPVTAMVGEGTRARPASSGGGAVITGDVWGALAQCESGGNPAAVSSNGLYYGLYQFSLGTWGAMGGSGLPSNASPAEQLQRAQALQARSGWGQWPACAASLGLL